MKIVTTSDWHGDLPETVPTCDLLILAGDYGVDSVKLGNWLDEQPAKHIVGIAGNIDFEIEKEPKFYRQNLGWTYLQDSGTEIEGLKVWGSPWSVGVSAVMPFQGNEDDLAARWALIPSDTEILVTHGPPHGVGDYVSGGVSVGSTSLMDKIIDLPKLRLHVFGHIHESTGINSFVSLRLVNTAKHVFEIDL